MVSAEQSNQVKAYLRKAEEYMESAEDNLELERYTPAAGDSIHAGISAKDAIVTSLVGTTRKSRCQVAVASGKREEDVVGDLIGAAGKAEPGAHHDWSPGQMTGATPVTWASRAARSGDSAPASYHASIVSEPPRSSALTCVDVAFRPTRTSLLYVVLSSQVTFEPIIFR